MFHRSDQNVTQEYKSVTFYRYKNNFPAKNDKLPLIESNYFLACLDEASLLKSEDIISFMGRYNPQGCEMALLATIRFKYHPRKMIGSVEDAKSFSDIKKRMPLCAKSAR